MKPTLQSNHTDRQRDLFASRRSGSKSPKVDYFFQAPSPEFSGYRRGDGASFRSISQDYFAREARGHFKAEALIFGLIAVTAAVPIVEAIRGLSQLFHGVV
ncbi:MAG: hypothetical protein ABI946_10770 [Chthoniobacterales bacterium]